MLAQRSDYNFATHPEQSHHAVVESARCSMRPKRDPSPLPSTSVHTAKR